MAKLDSTLSTVMDFSDKVTSAFKEKREKISKLSGVHILLQKVCNICDWGHGRHTGDDHPNLNIKKSRKDVCENVPEEFFIRGQQMPKI